MSELLNLTEEIEMLGESLARLCASLEKFRQNINAAKGTE